MADQRQGGERGFGRGGRGGRGGARGDARGGAAGGRGDARGGRGGKRAGPGDVKEEKWTPVTKLGRLVKDRHIKLEEIYLMGFPIKEYQIIDYFMVKDDLKDEVLKISPVQKQTRAGQRTRFKAYVIIGDANGHCGLGIKCSKEVATAIRGAIILAKLSLVPVRRGYWGGRIGDVHTIPMKLTGKCGSVAVRLVPAPRGTGIVAARVPKKLLQFAGVQDVYTSSVGHTKTLGNFVKATFFALSKSYGYLTPDLWFDRTLPADHLQVHAVWLANTAKTSEAKRNASE